MKARGESQCSLDGAGHLREDSASVRANHSYSADDNHEDHCEHDRVFGYVLSLCTQTSSDYNVLNGLLHSHTYHPHRGGGAEWLKRGG
jgi:hypothetical protein